MLPTPRTFRMNLVRYLPTLYILTLVEIVTHVKTELFLHLQTFYTTSNWQQKLLRIPDDLEFYFKRN